MLSLHTLTRLGLQSLGLNGERMLLLAREAFI